MTRKKAKQVNLFGQDSWSGKTCQEHSAVMEGRTSEPSLKKPQESQMKPLQFLDLETINGILLEPSWEEVSLLPGELSTLNTGECPNVVAESSLSQILQATVPEKYFLSKKACQGDIAESEKAPGEGRNAASIGEGVENAITFRDISRNTSEQRMRRHQNMKQIGSS